MILFDISQQWIEAATVLRPKNVLRRVNRAELDWKMQVCIVASLDSVSVDEGELHFDYEVVADVQQVGRHRRGGC